MADVRRDRPEASLGWRIAGFLIRRREASIFLVAVALFVYFAVLNPNFLTLRNMRVVSQFTAAVAILAAGQVMLLICGEIDLSIGHTFALAPFIVFFGLQAGIPLLLIVVLAVLGAGVVGLINGVVTVKTGVPSFITTLGMLFLLNGFTLTISGGFPKRVPQDGVLLGLLGDYPFIGFFWAIVVTGLMYVLLNHTAWGVATFATGGNPIGAREAGVPTARIKIGNFVIAAMLGGFAGILESIRVNSFDPLLGGESIMFAAVAAAVIGGTALAGGSGTIVGGFLGALVLGVLKDGFTLQGISAFTFNMILGLAIIVAMILNVRLGRLRIRAGET